MSKSLHPVPTAPAPSLAPRQLDILLDSIPTEKMSASERAKAIASLANLLMQAAGLVTQERDDDER